MDSWIYICYLHKWNLSAIVLPDGSRHKWPAGGTSSARLWSIVNDGCQLGQHPSATSQMEFFGQSRTELAFLTILSSFLLPLSALSQWKSGDCMWVVPQKSTTTSLVLFVLSSRRSCFFQLWPNIAFCLCVRARGRVGLSLQTTYSTVASSQHRLQHNYSTHRG